MWSEREEIRDSDTSIPHSGRTGGRAMARTGNNIYKRKDGRYEGRILVEKSRGQKSGYIYVYARTLKEVKKKMETIRKQRQTPEREKAVMNITVKDAAEGWMDEMKKKWRPTTCGMYQSVVNHYVIPILGTYMVSEINEKELGRFAEALDGYSARGSLSEQYKKYICSLACQILDYAISTYHLGKKGPAVPDFQVRKNALQLPPEQDMMKLKQYLMAHLPDDTCLGILVAMNTGIRIGELCALKWGDFDLEKGILVIQRNLQRIKNDEKAENGKEPGKGKTRVHTQMPKSTSSNRLIPLADDLVTVLRACQKAPDHYLISGQKKEWAEVRTLQYRFSAILKKCQISPFHFHLLRHSFASQCMELGCDIKSLSEILGHSSIQITMNIYVHSSLKQKKDMMNLVCRLSEQS